jgi:predicted DNA-binding ribbon-helix-helix protein
VNGGLKKPHNILDKITNMVHNDVMAYRIIDKEGSAVRASVSFSHRIYDSLGKIAEAKKVSIAWVVREAVETYLNTAPDKAVLEKQGNV